MNFTTVHWCTVLVQSKTMICTIKLPCTLHTTIFLSLSFTLFLPPLFFSLPLFLFLFSIFILFSENYFCLGLISLSIKSSIWGILAEEYITHTDTHKHRFQTHIGYFEIWQHFAIKSKQNANIKNTDWCALRCWQTSCVQAIHTFPKRETFSVAWLQHSKCENIGLDSLLNSRFNRSSFWQWSIDKRNRRRWRMSKS